MTVRTEPKAKDTPMTRNERTSARVSKIAAKVLGMDETEYFWWATNRTGQAEVRALAASALTQTADRKLSPNGDHRLDDMGFDPRDGGKIGRESIPARKRGAKNQRHLVRVKAEGFDRVLIGPVELMKPKRAAGRATAKGKRPSSYPPSAKPGRDSP